MLYVHTTTITQEFWANLQAACKQLTRQVFPCSLVKAWELSKKERKKQRQLIIDRSCVFIHTYHIAGNFRWYKISWKCIQTLQKKFSWNNACYQSGCIFTQPVSTPVDGYTPHVNWRQNNTERRSTEASLSNNVLVFLCVEVFAITKVSIVLPWMRNWLCWSKGFSTADLDFDNFRASLTGLCAFCIVAGWFFSTVQTDCREPSRSHGY